MERAVGAEFGAAVATARSARRLTQEQLAAAAMISVSLLRKVEQGVRPATPPVLRALAEVLQVDVDQLAGGTPELSGRVHAAIPSIRRALDSYEFPEDGAVRSKAELRGAVAEAQRWRLGSQYARLAQTVPGLIAELSRALWGCSVADRPELAALLVSALRSLDGATYKFGYHDLSGRIIDLMGRVVDAAADELLAATVAYVRTETFFVTGNLPAALRALQMAATEIRPGSRPAAAVYGALQMRAAVVAGRLGDRDAARAHLVEARAVAGRVGEGVYCGTAFGPDSVRVHEVAVAVELGDATAALRAAGAWAPSVRLPAERRSHYYVDLAKAQLWAGRRAAALASLQTARQIAPQHVRQHPYVRDTVATLVRLGRGSQDTVLSYANWLRLT